ncbi:MAG: hypothetical protein AUK19_00360 [Candidatus Moranbacteria bacterium CG2_30_45_14]|nr:MAG: hypothetical protein AUK19_00360 [Candidatus Moranbacteria bacterium CG2_30_45_14]
MVSRKFFYAMGFGTLSTVALVGVSYFLLMGKDIKTKISSSAVGTSVEKRNTGTAPESFERFVHPKGYFTFSYPNGWKVYISKGEDTSVGDIIIVPERNLSAVSFRSGNNEYPRLPIDKSGVDEYIIVSGAFMYSFATDREKYLPEFRNYYLDIAQKIEKQSGIINFTKKELSYDGAPAFVFEYNQDNQIHYIYSTLAKGFPSEKASPVGVGFVYVATPEHFDQKIADALTGSFSDNIRKLQEQIEKIDQERKREANKDLKPTSITQNSTAGGNKPLSSLLTDWDGRFSSDPTEKNVSITQTTVSFLDKTEQAINIKLNALGESTGIFRNFIIPKDTYAIQFCLNFQGIAGKDNVSVFSDNKLLLNYGFAMPKAGDFIETDVWTKTLGVDTGIDAPLMISFANRSGTPSEVTLSRFRMVSSLEVKQPAYKSLNCKTK